MSLHIVGSVLMNQIEASSVDFGADRSTRPKDLKPAIEPFVTNHLKPTSARCNKPWFFNIALNLRKLACCAQARKDKDDY